MHVELLQPFGVAIAGIDAAAPVSPATAAALRDLYRRHRLLVLRGQRLTSAQQTRFTALFDDAVAAVDDGVISNASEVGKLGDTSLAFHSDYAFTAEPLLTIALHAVDVADERSATLFVPVALNGIALSGKMRARLATLELLTVYGLVPDRRNDASIADSLPNHVHPAIVAHPRTGEPILFASQNQSARVVGLPPGRERRIARRAGRGAVPAGSHPPTCLAHGRSRVVGQCRASARARACGRRRPPQPAAQRHRRHLRGQMPGAGGGDGLKVSATCTERRGRLFRAQPARFEPYLSFHVAGNVPSRAVSTRPLRRYRGGLIRAWGARPRKFRLPRS
ncbi:MAG: TauD/TfdA family dioxygenase [Sphingomonadaceae bacterium]|nr:TauD/TfdA family dioxygenase [Sphingomonadaceae bacterium]